MVTRSMPDYTFGELGGIDDLASLGIEIQDDAPAPQEERRRRPPPNKVRRLREALAWWKREQEDKLIAINPQAVANDRATAEGFGLEDLLPEYDDILAQNESIPGRIRDRLADLGKDLPQANLGKYGKRGVWWAEVDPLTHRWIVPADKESVAAGDLVVGEFNGALRSAVIEDPANVEDGILLDAGSDQVLGNRVGRVLERFGYQYRDVKRRHESGELRQQWEEQEALSGRGLPERHAAPAATDTMTDEAGDAPASEDAGDTQYSDAIAGMAANMTAGGRLKGRNISSTMQQRELQGMANANPELAAHLGMPVDRGLTRIPWSNLSRADAAKLIGIFNDADDYAMRQQGIAIEVAQATVRDPETGEQVVLTASKEGDGPTVVTAQGEPGELMNATEAAMEDVAEQSAAPSEPAGDTEGSGFEPLPEGYDLSAYGFGDQQGDDPSPAVTADTSDGSSAVELDAVPSEHQPADTQPTAAPPTDLSPIIESDILRAKHGEAFAVVPTAEANFDPPPEYGYEGQAYVIYKVDAEGRGDLVRMAYFDSREEARQAAESMDRVGVDQWQKLQREQAARPVPAKRELAQPAPMLADALEAHTQVDESDSVAAPETEASGFEPLPEGYDLSAYGFGDPDAASEAAPTGTETEADAETAALAQRLRGNILAGSDLSDAELVARHMASQRELEEDERRQQERNDLRNRQFEQATAYIRERDPELLGHRGKARIWGGVQHGGKIAVPEGTDVQPGDFVVARDMQAGVVRDDVYKLTTPKGLGYAVYENITSQRTGATLLEKHGTAYVEWHSPSETAAAPSSDDDPSPASEPSAEASEPEPEAPALAPVLADAEPGPAEPPAIITPTTGKGPAEPPQVASVSRNDTAEHLQQKWRQADRSIDTYAKSFGISGIPDDAARLELRQDGTIGVERLRVTPQGSAYRTPARQTSGSGGSGGGGGSSSPTKASAPAIGLRKSWERMSLAEKQAVIDVINDALARRALLSTALVTMTCSPTGDLSLSSGQKMATIVGSCAPRSSPVSLRQSLPDHPWLSKREVATFGGNKRRSGQNQRAKKTKSRR